jgi:cyclophilin family peptidyl-prolyl cis-trans isomerase
MPWLVPFSLVRLDVRQPVQRVRRSFLWVTLILTIAACGTGDTSSPDPGATGGAPLTRPSDALLEFSGLTGLVSVASVEDIDGLVNALSAPESAARARAAFLFASFRDSRALEPLMGLLEDSAPAVRADAAFALGEWGADARPALEPLIVRAQAEEDEGVRERVIRAVGRIGGADAARFLVSLSHEGPDAAARAWGLATIAVRGSAEGEDDGVLRALAGLLTDGEGPAREAAAWGLWRIRTSPRLDAVAPAVFSAVERVHPTDAARGWVVATALSLPPLGEAPAPDLSALLGAGEGIATRILAVRALEGTRYRDQASARHTVLRLLSDASTPLAVAASETVAAWGRSVASSADPGARGSEALSRSALWDELKAVVPALPELPWQRLKPLFDLAVAEDPQWVREWVGGPGASSPLGLQHAVRALKADRSPEAESLLFGLSSHEHPLVRAALVDALAAHWGERRGALAGDLDGIGRYAVFFADEVASGPPVSSMRAARLLLDPAFAPLETVRVLEEALAVRYRDGHSHLVDSLSVVLAESRVPRVLSLLDMMAESNLSYRVRRAGDRALQRFDGRASNPERIAAPTPEYPLDWPAIQSFGPRPRLEIETSEGTILLVLDAEQAPQTVQAITDQANSGLHDGTHFHRVVPNFVIQAGDVSLGDGTGGPGYSIRTETTWIPFERGVIGMASSGRDTEGSQWFITHSRQPHLDGAYTAFGWMISGWDVLDRIAEGDRILRMRVTADPAWVARF